MNHIPYSLADAEKICREFQHLTGKPFGNGIEATIDCVAVTPFDQENRNRFIIYYLLFDDARIALNQDYQGMLYDVIVIAGAKEGNELLHESLGVWQSKDNAATHCEPAMLQHPAPTSAVAAYN